MFVMFVLFFFCEGTSGIYSRGFGDVFQVFFQKKDDRALSVVRASQNLISMQLPVDPTTHTRKVRPAPSLRRR